MCYTLPEMDGARHLNGGVGLHVWAISKGEGGGGLG